MTPQEIVSKMLEGDEFSKVLGMELISVDKGQCSLGLTVTDEMVNGFGIAHGGITYSLSDSCLAFASNAHGKKAVSIETSISHTKSLNVGDYLIASCKELNKGRTIGVYQVEVRNQKESVAALFKGTVFFKDENW